MIGPLIAPHPRSGAIAPDDVPLPQSQLSQTFKKSLWKARSQPSVVLQPGEVTAHEAIRGALPQFLALGGTISIETIAVTQTDDVALLRARWRVKGTGPDGNPAKMQGNSVEVIRQQADGRWVFLIDQP